jgi:polygalacturonase
MQNGHGGIVVDSEISGGCKNIFVEDCIMSSPDLDRAIRIKSNSHRGGVIEDFFVRNIKVCEVKEAVIKINCKYEPTDGIGNFPLQVKNIYISGVTSQKLKYSFYLLGLENSDCINNIYISNSDFNGVNKKNFIKDAGNIHVSDVKINGTILNLD